MYKTTPELSKSQVHKLDCVRQAAKSMWSPSREDLKKRLQEDFVNVDFSIDDVELYFNMFPDVNAIKGKTQLPEVHRRSSVPSLKENQVLLSCDVMHLAGGIYMVGIINSPKENNEIGIQSINVSTSCFFLQDGLVRREFRISVPQTVAESGMVFLDRLHLLHFHFDVDQSSLSIESLEKKNYFLRDESRGTPSPLVLQ